MNIRFIHIILFLLLSLNSWSQNLIHEVFWVQSNPEPAIAYESFLKLKRPLPRAEALKAAKQKLQLEAFLEFQIDSVKVHNDSLLIWGAPGKKYYWNTIKTDSFTSIFFEKNKMGKGLILNPIQLQNAINVALKKLENSGFPFARYSLQDVKIQNAKVDANLKLEKGPKILWDSIIMPNPIVSQSYLKQLVKFESGEVYREEVLQDLEKRIKNSDFMILVEPIQVVFIGNHANIIVKLRNKNNNILDGLVGFKSDPVLNKIRFTGSFDIKWWNAFKQGELLSLKWEAYGAQQQLLHLHIKQSYFLGTSWGWSNTFEMLKQDSNYINIHEIPVISYHFSEDERVYFQGKYFSSQSIAINQSPDITNTLNWELGLGVEKSSWDFKANPRKAYFANVFLLAGKKTITSSIDTIKSQQLSTASFGINFQKYFPLWKRASFLFSNQSQGLMTKTLSTNEMLRIGGLHAMRGFDEASIYAEQFSISTFEYRFLFQQYSNFILFYDFGITDYFSPQNHIYQGVGLGVNLEMGSGVLQFFAALGKKDQDLIRFRSTKIHIGYQVHF